MCLFVYGQLGITTPSIIEEKLETIFPEVSFPRIEFAKERHWYQIWKIEEERPLLSGDNCQMHGKMRFSDLLGSP